MPTYQLGLIPARGVINVATGADLIFVMKKQEGNFPEGTTAQLVFNQSQKVVQGNFVRDYVVFRLEYAESDKIPANDTWKIFFRYLDLSVSDYSDDYCVMYGTLKRYN